MPSLAVLGLGHIERARRMAANGARRPELRALDGRIVGGVDGASGGTNLFCVSEAQLGTHLLACGPGSGRGHFRNLSGRERTVVVLGLGCELVCAGRHRDLFAVFRDRGRLVPDERGGRECALTRRWSGP